MGVRDKIAKAVMDAVGGIKAYHSSPHDFDRFDLSKIGTGEGAQVYGHGIYAAENPAVSGQGGQYWQQFLNHPALTEAQQHAGGRLRAESFDKEKAIAATQRDVNDWLQMTQPADAAAQLRGQSTSYYDRAHAQKMLALRQGELDALVSGKAGPRTYELNIKEDPARFLQWDQPLPEHGPLAERVDQAYRSVHPTAAPPSAYGYTGNRIYKDMADALRKPEVSARLQDADIPGIKYLDQGSRNFNPGTTQWIAEQGGVDKAREIAQARYNDTIMKYGPAHRDARDWAATLKEIDNPPTSNYVVFDPSIIDITKKYALPGALGAGAMGSIAAQDQYEVAP
jgi:hypothetical protein